MFDKPQKNCPNYLNSIENCEDKFLFKILNNLMSFI